MFEFMVLRLDMDRFLGVLLIFHYLLTRVKHFSKRKCFFLLKLTSFNFQYTPKPLFSRLYSNIRELIQCEHLLNVSEVNNGFKLTEYNHLLGTCVYL